jgi:hypothetical protein
VAFFHTKEIIILNYKFLGMSALIAGLILAFIAAGCEKKDTTAPGTAATHETVKTEDGITVTQPQTTYSLAKGDIIVFGRQQFNWLVLDVKDDKALLITESIITRRRFDSDSNVWESSEIRRYLNEDFYNAFSAFDKEHIAETTVITPYGETTIDKIFLLSEDEAERYFSDNNARIPSYGQKWWLRSGGHRPHHAAIVGAYGEIGGDYFFEAVDNSEIEVRPALWLNLINATHWRKEHVGKN